MTALLALLRPLAPWLAAPLLAGGVWLWRDSHAAADLREAARICALERRAETAEADAHAERTRNEIEREMDAVRPAPDAVRERLRDGDF